MWLLHVHRLRHMSPISELHSSIRDRRIDLGFRILFLWVMLVLEPVGWVLSLTMQVLSYPSQGTGRPSLVLSTCSWLFRSQPALPCPERVMRKLNVGA